VSSSFIHSRDANTRFFANRISVVENWHETDFWFYWPSQKFKFQAHVNFVIYLSTIFDHLMKAFENTEH